MSKRFIYIVCIGFGCFWVRSQGITDPDNSFLSARNIAFEGNRTVARDSLERILASYPDYTDAAILIAKTYTWDKDYNEARKRFNRILSVKRQKREAWLAAIKNELYSKNLNIALGLSNKALIYLREDKAIEELRNQVVFELNKKPPIQEKLKEENKNLKRKNGISVSTTIEIFDVVFDPMYETSIAYQTQTKFGQILPRINYAQRFDQTGTQFEVDAYPTISKTFHGYLNYGYSNAVIFPKHRAGLELYAELPKAFEVSLGARHVRFTENNATIFTGSFGMYRGNYYVSARPFVSVRNDGQMGWAGNVLARKYGKDGNHFFGVRATYGFDSELNQFIVDGELLSATQLFLETQLLNLEYQFADKNNIGLYTLNAGVRRQELFFDSGNFFWGVSFGLRYQFRF
ncbi:hypothetical protein FGF1_39350 [Flavobacteriaceae bacterium GF1]